MDTVFSGKALVLGKNIDTDQIYPGRFLAITDPEEIGSHCFSGIDERIAAEFPAGGIVVAGTNFGCGSSREHAPIALIHMGAKAVIAESFARIFFRNAINLGLIPVICEGISNKVANGQTLTVDLDKGTVTVNESKETLPCSRLGEQERKILEAGGMAALIRQKLSEENK